jgi:hypothetical protein
MNYEIEAQTVEYLKFYNHYIQNEKVIIFDCYFSNDKT